VIRRLEILGILGFFLILGSWFVMYFRVRREHPQSPLARYSNYIGVRKSASWRLVGFYRHHYGFDAWMWGFWIGAALIVMALLGHYLP